MPHPEKEQSEHWSQFYDPELDNDEILANVDSFVLWICWEGYLPVTPMNQTILWWDNYGNHLFYLGLRSTPNPKFESHLLIPFSKIEHF